MKIFSFREKNHRVEKKTENDEENEGSTDGRFGKTVRSFQNPTSGDPGSEKGEVEGQVYFAISGIVPVYKAMEGKKQGEEYTFNGNKTKILDVF